MSWRTVRESRLPGSSDDLRRRLRASSCVLGLAALVIGGPVRAGEAAAGAGADGWTAGNASGLFSFTAAVLVTETPGLGQLRLGAEVAYLVGGAEFGVRFAFEEAHGPTP
jgi:hypothetical protein